ncbi:ABC transporter permease [Pseudogemmobacter humi]|uniref:Glutathione transport system permease protein GsiC n=1 Tax=Pseudogemmobacter humi TaxID=2483812 RepID=A0A3P5WV71_9RHOB|nr:ABC transporter permease [Pseudogemmobacter humi]VDC22366.1 Glutathione transport system permease protein GsiC [Pseudogemmobacter humi]
MLKAGLGRVIKVLMVLITVIICNFALVRLAPGDPVSVIAGETGASDAAFVASLREEFQLDKPIHVQLGTYLANVATGDLGYSYRQRRPVADLIWERMPATLLLTGTAFVLSLVVGVASGIFAGLKRGTWGDNTLVVLCLFGYALPAFWLGLVLVLIFSVWLQWLPAFGMQTLGFTGTWWEQAADVARHLVLPAVTLSAYYIALYTRVMRSSVADVQSSDFIKTARARGLSRRRIIGVHMLRNAALPVITLAGVQAGQLIGGSIVVETVFAWPGIGRLALDSLLQREYMVLLGVFIVTSVMVIALNIITDIILAIVDPRIRKAAA